MLDFYIPETCCTPGCESYLTENPENGFNAFNAPLIVQESGCLAGWNSTGNGAIFMDNATSTWSGVIMDGWTVWLSGYSPTFHAPWGADLPYPQYNASGVPESPSISPPYTALQSQWATLMPSGMLLSEYTPTILAPGCPTSLPGKTFNTNAPLPTLGVKALPSSLLSQLSTRTSSPTLSESSPTPTTSPGSTTGGLTTGDKIAVGLVIPTVVIGIVAGFIWYQRKKIQAKEKSKLEPHSNLEAVQHEKTSAPHGKYFIMMVFDQSQTNDHTELEAKDNQPPPQQELVPELDGHLETAELAADRHSNTHELDGNKRVPL